MNMVPDLVAESFLSAVFGKLIERLGSVDFVNKYEREPKYETQIYIAFRDMKPRCSLKRTVEVNNKKEPKPRSSFQRHENSILKPTHLS